MRRTPLSKAGLPILVLIACLGCTVPASSASETVVASVPLLNSSSYSAVEMTIDGRGPYWFVIDPGTSTTVVGRRIVEELSLSTEKVRLKNLRIGDLTLTDVRCDFLDLEKMWGDDAPHGIVGLGTFGDRLVTVDLAAREFVVSEGNLDANADEVLAFRFDDRDDHGMKRRVPTIEIELADETIRVDLDPGSFGSVSLNSDQIGKLSLVEEPHTIGYSQTDEGRFEILGATLDGSMTLAGREIASPGIFFSENFDHPSLGAKALDAFAVTFDAAHKLVRVHRPSGSDDPLLRQAAALEPQSGDGAALREAFNRDVDRVRLMVLLAPT